MSQQEKKKSEEERKTCPTSFKCQISNLTKEEIEQKLKVAKVFIPYRGEGNLEGAEPYKI